ASQDSVKLVDAAGEAGEVAFVDLVEGEGLAGAGEVAGLGHGVAGAGVPRDGGGAGVEGGGFVLFEGVPGAAVGALPHPLGVDAATLPAEELDAGFGHFNGL